MEDTCHGLPAHLSLLGNSPGLFATWREIRAHSSEHNHHFDLGFGQTILDKRKFIGCGGVEKWLRFFEMDGPLTCLSVLHVGDEEGEKLGLRMEHTHCFGEGGANGGHYHGDVKGEEVEYEGYFNLAECVYRIDQPV